MLEVSKTVRYSRDWNPETKESGTCLSSIDSSFALSWTVTVQTVPDPTQEYSLSYGGRGLASGTLGVQLSETGLLKGVNLDFKDLTAASVLGVARGVAGLALNIGAFADNTDPRQTLAGYRPTNERCLLRSTSPWSAGAKQDSIRLTVLAANLESAQSLLMETQKEIGTAGKVDDKAATTRIGALQQRVSLLQVRATEIASSLQAKTTAFALSSRIGNRDTVVVRRYVFDPGTLPTLESIADIATLTSQPSWGSMGVALALDRIGSPAAVAVNGKTVSQCESSKDGCARIYYRPRHVFKLVILTKSSFSDPTPILREERLISIATTSDPARFVSYSTKALSSGSVVIALDAAGNLASYEQKNTSTLSDAASALTSTITAVRQDYLDALKARKDAGGLQADIRGQELDKRLGPLADSLKALQARKALLDAEAGTIASGVTVSDAKEKAELQAQIDLLQLQIAATKAQDSLSTLGQNLTTAREIAELQTALAKLTADIEILKAKQIKDQLTPSVPK